MSNDGRTLTNVGYVNFFNSATKFNNIIQWKNNVYLIVYAGTANKGGGGGAGGARTAPSQPASPGTAGGAGGSGVVIIRYKFQ